MGRLVFTSDERDEIRSLLSDLRRADRDAQKRIRGKLRRQFDFNISDFDDGSGGGFTRSDFDDLVARGTIKIED